MCCSFIKITGKKGQEEKYTEIEMERRKIKGR